MQMPLPPIDEAKLHSCSKAQAIEEFVKQAMHIIIGYSPTELEYDLADSIRRLGDEFGLILSAGACPFCGGHPRTFETVEAPKSTYVVTCTNCGATGPVKEQSNTRREAIDKWNVGALKA